MPTILQLRRGTTTEHSSFTGAEGEVTVNTTKDTLVVHDGSTQGGFELALADGSNVSVSTEQIQDSASAMFTNATHTNITATYDDAAGTLSLATTGHYTDADARAAVSATGDLSYNSSTGVFSYTEPTMYADSDARGAISVNGDLAYNSGTGVISYTEPTMYADSDARGAVSVTDSGGDGSLAYNSTTGVITYTGPSATEVRAHFTGGTGIDITSGSVAVDSTIATKTYADSAASTAVAAVIDSSPAALNTLNELAAALGDDANFSTTVTNSIATKLNSSAVSAFGLTLVDDADAATARTTLGLGTAATTASTAYATAAQGATADAALPSASYTAADVLTKIKTVDGAGSGLDADLLDGNSSAHYATASSVTSEASTRASADTALDTRVTTAETKLSGIEAGATADQTAAEILTAIKTVDGSTSGLDADLLDGNHASAFATAAQGATADSAVQNLSDLSITSTATELNYTDGVTSNIQTQLNAKAPLASPALSGTPTAPTATAGTNTTQVATTAFVGTAVSNLVAAAPGSLDTLNELAAALGDDANFSTTVTNSIATKLALSGGEMSGNITFSGTETVDGRDISVDGAKLDGIESGATADQTAAEILTAIKTVDGTGSGLDADTLDGNQATAFATAAQGTKADSAVQNLGDLSITATAAEINKLDGVTATTAELNYTDGVTSNIQTQLNGKQASGAYLTGNQTITLSGDATGSGTTSIAVTVANDSHNHSSSTGAFTVGTDLTVSGGDITLSGTGRIQGVDTVSAGTDAANKSYVDTAVSNLVASAPGTLDTLNELAAALGDDPNFATTVSSSIGEKLAKASNLSDLANAATARTNLGLGSAATTASTAYATAAQGTKADSAVQNLAGLSITATATEINKLDGVTATTAELNFIDGVTSNIQTQLNGKATSAQGALADSAIQNLAGLGITSTAAEINKLDGFTGVVADLNYAKSLRATGVTSTEFDYLDGVTSNIQTQINSNRIDIYNAAGTLLN